MTATENLVEAMRLRLIEVGLTSQGDQVELLGSNQAAAPSPSTPLAPRAEPPVLAHLPAALETARHGLPIEVARALEIAATSVDWTRTAAYVARPPGPDFLDGYAHATLAGPVDGPDAGSTAASRDDEPTASLGLLLLGPHVHYPHHRHPADEVYLPLTGASWSHGEDEPFREEPPGVLLHHRPWQAHAMRTGDEPLLALYVWTGDVTVASAWC